MSNFSSNILISATSSIGTFLSLFLSLQKKNLIKQQYKYANTSP